MSLVVAGPRNLSLHPHPIHPLKFQSGLARVSYRLLEKHSKDFAHNPMDDKLEFLQSTLNEMIIDGQEKLEKLRKKTKKAESSCWLSKKTVRSLRVGAALTITATVTTLALSVLQCNASDTSVSSLVTGCVGGVLTALKDYAKDKKDDADDEAKKAREREREEEIKQAKLLLTFLSECQNFKQIPKKKLYYTKCTDSLKNCVDNLSKIPNCYKERMPSCDIWTSNMIKLLPRNHPTKLAVKKLIETAQKMASSGHLQRIGSLLGEQVLTSVASSPDLAGKVEENKPTVAALVKKESSDGLENEYQRQWTELEKMLPAPVDKIIFDGWCLTKKGAQVSPKSPSSRIRRLKNEPSSKENSTNEPSLAISLVPTPKNASAFTATGLPKPSNGTAVAATEGNEKQLSSLMPPLPVQSASSEATLVAPIPIRPTTSTGFPIAAGASTKPEITIHVVPATEIGATLSIPINVAAAASNDGDKNSGRAATRTPPPTPDPMDKV